MRKYMSRGIFIASFLLFSCSFLYSMELAPLTDKKTSQEEAKNYFERLPTLKLSKIRRFYNNLSDDCKLRIMWSMSDSDQLVLLHHVAMWLPREIQHKIVMHMFENMFGNKKIKHIKDNNEIVTENTEEEKSLIQIKECNRKEFDQAAKKFCKKPIGKMLRLCDNIKKNIRECDSVAFVFIMNKQERNKFFRELNPWYSSVINPILSIEDQKIIHELSDDRRQYFIGKQVNILPEGEENYCTPKKVIYIAGGTAAGGAVVGGSLIGGAACIYGKACACETTFLATVLGVTLGFVPCVGCLFATAIGVSTVCSYHKKDTL